MRDHVSWYRHRARMLVHKLLFHQITWFERWHKRCYFGLNPKEDEVWMR